MSGRGVEQALVIGLGQFGMALARALVTKGVEVVAVDRRQDRVAAASAFVVEAICADAIDPEQLSALGPTRRDVCVCAIGDESLESSIIVTTLLRQLGTRRVVARATSELHERILGLVGAHEVVNPERSFGERLASRLASHGVVDQVSLGEDLVITEVETPPAFAGRTLAELALPARFGVTLIAVRRARGGAVGVVLPTATERIHEGDILVLVSSPLATQAMLGSL